MSSLRERGDVVELRGMLRERFPEACRGVVGMAAEDAGMAAEDAGMAAEDAGMAAEDAGMAAEDAGMAAEDAGDAGTAGEGAGGGVGVEVGVEVGVKCLDAVGVRKGEVVEVVEVVGGCGGGLVVWGICGVEGRRVALVDGGDGFDPQDAGAEVCRRVLWVRCGGVEVAVKAADLLLRDGNLPLVVMDLGLCGERELGRVAGSSWFRLRSLAEATGAVLVVVTPRACVGCADVRVELAVGWGLEGMERPRVELMAELEGRVVKRRGGVGDGGGEVRRAG